MRKNKLHSLILFITLISTQALWAQTTDKKTPKTLPAVSDVQGKGSPDSARKLEFKSGKIKEKMDCTIEASTDAPEKETCTFQNTTNISLNFTGFSAAADIKTKKLTAGSDKKSSASESPLSGETFSDIDNIFLKPSFQLKINFKEFPGEGTQSAGSGTISSQAAVSNTSGSAGCFPSIPFTPAVFQAGTLNLSGAFSEINSPFLKQSSSGFYHVSANPLKLTASKASPSSNPKPLAQFYTVDFSPFFEGTYKSHKDSKEGRKTNLSFSFYSSIDSDYCPCETNYAASTCLQSDSKASKIGFSASFFGYNLEQQNNNWFSELPYFPLQRRFFSNLSAAFSNSFLKTKTSVNFYQGLKNQDALTIKTEASISGNFASLSFGFFTTALPSEVFSGLQDLHGTQDLHDLQPDSSWSKIFLTPSGKKIRPERQFSISPEFTFFTTRHPSRTKIGFFVLYDEKLTSGAGSQNTVSSTNTKTGTEESGTEESETEKTLKISAGFETKTKKLLYKGSFALQNIQVFVQESWSRDFPLNFDSLQFSGNAAVSMKTYPYLKTGFSFQATRKYSGPSSEISDTHENNPSEEHAAGSENISAKYSFSFSLLPEKTKSLSVSGSLKFKSTIQNSIYGENGATSEKSAEKDFSIDSIKAAVSWTCRCKKMNLNLSGALKASF